MSKTKEDVMTRNQQKQQRARDVLVLLAVLVLAAIIVLLAR